MILVHIHIPRTAGANLGVCLREQFDVHLIGYPIERFGDENTRNNPGEDHFRHLADRIREAQKEHEHIYIQGHVPYGIHRYIESPVKYFTVVRDPVRRVWSRYNAYISAQSYAIHKLWKKKYNWDFRTILEAGELEVCNDQTRLVIGTCRKNITVFDAKDAIYKLVHDYDWVGTTEDFWKSGTEFSKALGIEPKIQFNQTRLNSIPWTMGRHPTLEQRNLIIKYNLQDQKVYEYVRDRRLGLIPSAPMKPPPGQVVKAGVLS